MNKNTTATMFSSASVEWATPQDFYDVLNKEFHFGLDAAATDENRKCESWYTKKSDALNESWSGFGNVWCNPPYGRGIGAWVEKAYHESVQGVTVVMLLPARTDTKWWHAYIDGKAEFRFVKGRLKFGGCKNSAPFPSVVVVFHGRGY